MLSKSVDHVFGKANPPLPGRAFARAARQLVLALGFLCCLSVTGCGFGALMLESSVGPYNSAVTRVSEEQLLLNIVRLRYNDNPTRLDVSSIAAQYELSGSAEAQPFFAAQATNAAFKAFSTVLPNITGNAANRPTISLTPLDDPETIRGLFTPTTLDGIIFLAESSYPISTMFQLFVEYLNRVPNAPSASGPPREIIPEYQQFRRAIEDLQQLQDLGDVRFVREEQITEMGSPLPKSDVTASALVEAAKSGFEYRQQSDNTWALVKRDRRLKMYIKPEAAARPELADLRSVLHLKSDTLSYDVTVTALDKPFDVENGASPLSSINVYPRSVIQASYYLAHGVVVPPEHVACGLVKSIVDANGRAFDWQDVTGGLFTVHSVRQYRRPDCAAVAVHYRDYWFYVDDRDAESKTTFSLVLAMTRINLVGTKKGGPTLTLPLTAR